MPYQITIANFWILPPKHCAVQWFVREVADLPRHHNDLQVFLDPTRTVHAHSNNRIWWQRIRRSLWLWAIAWQKPAKMLAVWKSPAFYEYPNYDFSHDTISELWPIHRSLSLYYHWRSHLRVSIHLAGSPQHFSFVRYLLSQTNRIKRRPNLIFPPFQYLHRIENICALPEDCFDTCTVAVVWIIICWFCELLFCLSCLVKSLRNGGGFGMIPTSSRLCCFLSLVNESSTELLSQHMQTKFNAVLF